MNVRPIPLPSLTADPAVCRQWAKAIADTRYPDSDRPLKEIYIHPVDWRAAKKGAERSRDLRQKRRKPAADSSGNIIRDLVRQGKRSVAEQITVGDFRAAFIDKLVERLIHAAKEEPWHFHGFPK